MLHKNLFALSLIALATNGCQEDESGDPIDQASGSSTDAASSMDPDSDDTQSDETDSSASGFDETGASDPGGECFDCPCPDGSLGLLCPATGNTECLCDGSGGGNGGAAACSLNTQISGGQDKSFDAGFCSLGGTGNPSYNMVLGSDSGTRFVIIFEPGGNPDGVPFDTEVVVVFAGSAEPDVSTDWRFEGCAATLTTGEESGQLTVDGTVDCSGAELTEIDHNGEDGLGVIDPITIAPFDFSFWILG